MKYIKSKVDNVISIMNKLTDLEFAVFDIDSKLIASTEVYLEVKGEKVHSESIQDVLRHGNVIVNKPGHMPSCNGCRFVNNCPSTIEILSCIKMDNNPIGIVSVTSFSKEAHSMIDKDLNTYISLLENISELIVISMTAEKFKQDLDIIHMIIEQLIHESNKNYIVTDRNGNVLYFDNETKKQFLSYCNLYTNSIDQVFPKTVVSWIFSARDYSKKHFIIKGKVYNLHLNPIKVNDKILGYIIELKNETIKSNYLNINYLDSIVSKDKEIYNIKHKIKKISNSPSPVILTGKTGTGKDMFAKAIHYIGNRAKMPFVTINCSNIPESIFESELFGYEEGSFTGAKKGGKIGAFEMADGGSIFLDEIGELPFHLQAKLLRVLQESTIQRIGSTLPIPINVRLISATNRDLEEMMLEGKFRDDLFYRINVIPISLPPLKDRMDDLELLVDYFIVKHSNRLDKTIKSISQKALKTLKAYSWPGNVRELENAIEYGINMEDGSVLSEDNLPDRIKISAKNIDINIQDLMLQKQIDIITNRLDENGWDLKGKEKTALELGISLRTLYRKINERKKDIK